MTTFYSRRRFLKSLMAMMALAGFSKRGLTARVTLSSPLPELQEEWDVVVVGSGYGGSVLAARLALHTSLCVLERGKEWLPGSFPKTPPQTLAAFRTPGNPSGLLDYRIHPEVDVWVGSGLGGTSLINSNVALEPLSDVFLQKAWPKELQTKDSLQKLFGIMKQVKTILGVEKAEPTFGIKKQEVHKLTGSLLAGKQNAAYYDLDLAVHFRDFAGTNEYGVFRHPCVFCGDCNIGCNYHAKNSLDANYLPLARQNGAKFFTEVEVDHLEPDRKGGWWVHCLLYEGNPRPRRRTLHANTVFLAGGTLGSTQILLRTKEKTGLSFSHKLGQQFSANADTLGLNYNSDYLTNTAAFGSQEPPTQTYRTGPTITCAIDYRKGRPLSEQFVVQDGVIPSVMVSSLRASLPFLAKRNSEREKVKRIFVDLKQKQLEEGALNHSVFYLVSGHDNAEGVLKLDSNGHVELRWPNFYKESIHKKIAEQFETYAKLIGGTNVENPLRVIGPRGHFVTVHPLGGCPLGNTAHDGVVNHKGQVFRDTKDVYPGLYVADGSIVPTSLGVNPLLTITALAERIASYYLHDRGWSHQNE